MMPGGRGFNPKQMNMMMKQLGISVEEVDDAEEVIIKCASREIVISNPSVSIMDAQGQRTYQVVGDATELGAGEGGGGEAGSAAAAVPAEPAEPSPPSEEDIELVMEQAGVDKPTAEKALEEADGDLAEAIVNLTEE